MQINIDSFIKQFDVYTKEYLKTEEIRANVNIKIEHTYKVLEAGKLIAQEICEDEQYSYGRERIRALLLSCLFHDIGRFEQVRLYNTYKDALSCNHGHLGLKVLKKEGFLKELPLQEQYSINTAVLLHNTFMLPSKLPREYALILHAVRDADKADILRVMVENYVQPKENSDTIFLNVLNEDTYSPQVLENLLTGKPILYTDLVYVNDFRLLQGGWLKDIHFASIKKSIVQAGYCNIILEGLPQTKEMEEAKNYIYGLLNQ